MLIFFENTLHWIQTLIKNEAKTCSMKHFKPSTFYLTETRDRVCYKTQDGLIILIIIILHIVILIFSSNAYLTLVNKRYYETIPQYFN